MKPKPTYDEIALRAYFIALERHARGESGNPLEDWHEAERQLNNTLVQNAPVVAIRALVVGVVFALGLLIYSRRIFR